VRAHARLIHQPGQDRRAGVVTGEAERTQAVRSLNERERGGIRANPTSDGTARTDPSHARIRTNPSVVHTERTRASATSEGEGVSAEAIDPRKPLDLDAISGRCGAPVAWSWS
jgi:hypothetical protein